MKKEEPVYVVFVGDGTSYTGLTKTKAEIKKRKLEERGKIVAIAPLNEAARCIEWPGYKEMQEKLSKR